MQLLIQKYTQYAITLHPILNNRGHQLYVLNGQTFFWTYWWPPIKKKLYKFFFFFQIESYMMAITDLSPSCFFSCFNVLVEITHYFLFDPHKFWNAVVGRIRPFCGPDLARVLSVDSHCSKAIRELLVCLSLQLHPAVEVAPSSCNMQSMEALLFSRLDIKCESASVD